MSRDLVRVTRRPVQATGDVGDATPWGGGRLRSEQGGEENLDIRPRAGLDGGPHRPAAGVRAADVDAGERVVAQVLAEVTKGGLAGGRELGDSGVVQGAQRSREQMFGICHAHRGVALRLRVEPEPGLAAHRGDLRRGLAEQFGLGGGLGGGDAR